MRRQNLELLAEVGLNSYEQRALAVLMAHGVSDAAAICREGEIPTSKIYRAMEKLAELGLVHIQPTRPKLYVAAPGDETVDNLIAASRQRAERFAGKAQALRAIFSTLPESVRGRRTFVDVALGMESHVKRHVIHLAAAQKRIWSYMEQGDLAALEATSSGGFPLLRRVARNAMDRGVDHRVVFGFRYQSAPQLVAFLRKHRRSLEHVTGVRYSGELGHPFHVVDDDLVILSLDHPFIPEGRFASLLVRDRELAQRLAGGFQNLWSKAMADLSEIDFHPGR